MDGLKYKVIRSERQYKEYCRLLEELVFSEKKTKGIQDEIDLLTLLIETWDDQHYRDGHADPIQILKTLMAEHQLRPNHLVQLLGISKGYVSDILNYKKGLSKEVIRKLADHFKLKQEAFNKPYNLQANSPEKVVSISKNKSAAHIDA